MSNEQEERILKMGAKPMDQVLDEQIGVKGSPERIQYEQELAKEKSKYVAGYMKVSKDMLNTIPEDKRNIIRSIRAERAKKTK